MFRAYGGLLRLGMQVSGKTRDVGKRRRFFPQAEHILTDLELLRDSWVSLGILDLCRGIAGTRQIIVKDGAKCVLGGRAGSAFSRHGRNLQNQEDFVQNFFCAVFIAYDCFITCTHCDRRVFKIHKAASTSI